MYIKTICRIPHPGGDILQVSKHYPGNFGAPGVARHERKKATPEEIGKNNHRNRVRRLQRIILANFPRGRTVHLTYRMEERPESFAEALDQRTKFMAKVRRACRKKGVPWKWIAVTEQGKRGKAYHHHLIIEDVTDPIDLLRLITELWPYGRVTSTAMEEEEDLFEELAEYLVKKETKGEVSGKSYSRSRNLIVPQERRETVHARRWRKEPKAPKGWYIVKGSVWNAFTPDGSPVQRYSMRQIVDNSAAEKNGLRQDKMPRGRDLRGLKS